jgi:carbamoyl-phosphate synthase large subunit
VLGGRAMRVVRSEAELETYLREVYSAVEGSPSILLDQFLEGALELDVDCLCDGKSVVIAGVMEHIEAAGIHSGDSACVLPPVHLSAELLEEVHTHTKKLALEIGVKGLMNCQYAIYLAKVYVLEANPRASRTVPFVSKAIGHPLAKYAALIATGKTLEDLNFTIAPIPSFYSAKEVHLPFLKFAGVIPVLGPEMKSTGESMGMDSDPYIAYYRAQLGANVKLPLTGCAVLIGANLENVAMSLSSSGWTVESLQTANLESPLPDLVIDLTGSKYLRKALENGTAHYTTLEAATWIAEALKRAKGADLGVSSLQVWQNSSL